MCSPTPVSYTHLDVYKRQAVQHLAAGDLVLVQVDQTCSRSDVVGELHALFHDDHIAFGGLDRVVDLVDHSLGPVSYTHLLYDAGQLYNKLRSTVVAEYPLASLLLPGWSLGSYISQDQLATLLGVDPTATSLQQVNDFQLDLKQLKTVQPANAKEGYLYLQLPNLAAGEDAPQLILGIEKQGLLKTLSPKVHILLDVPAHHIHAELSGTVTAAQTEVTAPTSRMQDSDVESLVQLRKTIESIVQFVQSAAQSDAASPAA